MTHSTLAVPIAFLFISLILLWAVIGSKGWWWSKTGIIAMTLYFGVAIWFAVSTYLGWPAKEELPYVYRIHWVFVEEPSKISNDPGGIYMWVKEIENDGNSNPYLNALAYRDTEGEPRVYKIPYDKDLHRKILQMLQQLKKGRMMIGGKGAPGYICKRHGNCKKNGKCTGKCTGPPGKGKNGDKNGSGSLTRNGDRYFYSLPPPKFSEKILGNESN